LPNWCWNNIEISGPAEDLKKLVEQVKGEKTALDFNKVIPYPEDWAKADKLHHQVSVDRDAEAVRQGYKSYYDMPNDKREVVAKQFPEVPDGYNNGGYTWCHENWGTKWNVDADIQGDPVEECVDYTFDSAWAPPEPIVKKLGEMFPTLAFHLKYNEPGMCFEGDLEIIGGKVTLDNCYDMPTYKCLKCGNEQQIPTDDDCGECWECGEGDWTELEVKDKDVKKKSDR